MRGTRELSEMVHIGVDQTEPLKVQVILCEHGPGRWVLYEYL